MICRRTNGYIWAGLLAVAVAGCAETFLGLGNLLSNVGGGLHTVGTCLSPLEPIDLNGVFAECPPVQWTDDLAQITDAPQPDVQAFLSEQLGRDILPAHYLGIRFYQLGALTGGDIIEVESLGDRIACVYLYDADFTLIPGGPTRDFDGRRRILQIPIPSDSAAAYLRIDLEFLSETGEPIARLARRADLPPPRPQPQTVVLDFAGQAEVMFRSGSLLPASIAPIDNPVVREAAAGQFRAIYAAVDLTVMTNADPPPEDPFSVIYIGPADPPFDYFGLAETCDDRNTYHDDVAVVDANQPVLQLARLLGPDTYGRALGTIAAHEMGHLLGLSHVSDADALMTGARGQGTNLDIERMLGRRFKTAPVTLAVSDLQEWVIGYQDAPGYLREILGPAPAAPP